MIETSIQVDKLSKRYTIGLARQNDTLRDVIADAVTNLNPFNHSAPVKDKSSFWALKDISFDVHRGEVLGIIGPNGAGKTTLLKILSRVTEPTSGRAVINGRVGSLLEVGTGFHPELTGRENIYLNGAILGMSRLEIDRKLDEIVTFSGIEDFINTPVKRFSSGMYVRLAFSVAAHLETDVLFIDEVLAVGDISFQNKCIKKIDNVMKDGRTIILVSHNMDTITQLCEKSIYLEHGVIKFIGDTVEAIDDYYFKNEVTEEAQLNYSTENFTIRKISIFGINREDNILPLHSMTIEFEIEPKLFTRDLSAHIIVKGTDHKKIFGLDSVDFGGMVDISNNQTQKFRINIKQCPLPPGQYYLEVYAKSYSNQVFEKVVHNFSFIVSESLVYGRRSFDHKWHGNIVVDAKIDLIN